MTETLFDSKLLEVYSSDEIADSFPQLRVKGAKLFERVDEKTVQRACLLMIRDQHHDEMRKWRDIRGYDPELRNWEKQQLKRPRGRAPDEVLQVFREAGFARNEALEFKRILRNCLMPGGE